MNILSLDKVEFIISMAREVSESSRAIIGDELADDTAPRHYSEFTLAATADTAVSEENAGDSVYQELKSVINGMNEEERSELVALMWLGRGTYTSSEWNSAVEDARAAGNDHTAEYLMRTPLLPDYLTEGLALVADE
ncbi:MAG: DUF3775 domain-containing protein [Emcibacter sp.]|nr:DUF3775 domain-containing protein [Emcibacter sp.]